MNNNQTYGTRKLANGVEISNNTFETGLNNNDLIIGGSGSSKTGSVVFNLLLNPCGSLVVSDTKGLLYRRFANYLEKEGYKVLNIDFITPTNGIGYNPLDYVRKDDNGNLIESDIKKLANTLMPRLDKDEPFWEKAATRYICMLIGFVLEALPPEEQNMISVLRLHREILNGSGMGMLKRWSNENRDSYCAKKFREMNGTAVAEKTWACITEFANEGLEFFSYNDLYPIFGSENRVNLRQIGNEKTVLFLKGSDNDTSFHILSTIFFNQLLQVLIESADNNLDGRLKVPTRIILDDFAASAAIEDFDNVISIIRSRDISVSVIIQSMSQLKRKYSEEEANSILNNCDHILYMAGKDYETSKLIANYLNKPIPLILNLPKSQAVLISSGEGGRIVDKLRAYHVCKEIADRLDTQTLNELQLGKDIYYGKE